MKRSYPFCYLIKTCCPCFTHYTVYFPSLFQILFSLLNLLPSRNELDLSTGLYSLWHWRSWFSSLWQVIYDFTIFRHLHLWTCLNCEQECELCQNKKGCGVVASMVVSCSQCRGFDPDKGNLYLKYSKSFGGNAERRSETVRYQMFVKGYILRIYDPPV